MPKIILLLSIFFFLNTQAQIPMLSKQIGNTKKIVTNKNTIYFELENAFATISIYNATTIRVRVNTQPLVTDFSFAIDNLTPKGTAPIVSETKDQVTIKTDSLTCIVTKNPFRVSFYNNKKELLNADDATLGISWFGNNVHCYKQMHSTEKFLGLGEKTGGINRRGNYYYNWNSDVPGYATNADPLYSTIPFFIGIRENNVYGIFFDNTFKSHFNFGGGADNEIYSFGADAGEMNYYFFGGNTIPKIIEDYTALTGRTPMPPLWSLGFQQSRWGYESQEQMLELAKNFRQKKLPADVLVSDINYMDNYKIFTWSNKFPDVKEMMKTLNEQGFEMVTIIDPGIKIEEGYKQYDEGIKENHFAVYPGGKKYVGHVWPGRCHFPDFTKPATQKWWGNNFKEAYVENGIKGFWNDMNEPAAWGREFPNLIEFGEVNNKKTLYEVKNAYGSLMAKSTYEGTKNLMQGKRPFVLTRAAYAGIQKYSAQWTGDNVATDEHMLLGFRLLNSMGISGVPYVGMDIGGFMGNPSPELFMRWLSLAVYSPLFRNHTHIGYNYREPWLFGEFNTHIIREILEQRYQLLPHLYSSFYQAHITGLPINRMLPIYHPTDEKVYKPTYENQFYFGDNILVAPCTSQQQYTEVYLPGNKKWYRLNSNEVYEGGNAYTVKSPINNLPVFVQAGAIIPMQHTIQHTKEKGDGILLLHIYKGNEPTTYTYYEDDGETYNYEKGNFYKREILYDGLSNKLQLKPKEGSYTSKFNKLKIILHGFEQNKELEYNLQNSGMIIDLIN